jgi:hypothetical protein
MAFAAMLDKDKIVSNIPSSQLRTLHHDALYLVRDE